MQLEVVWHSGSKTLNLVSGLTSAIYWQGDLR